MKATPIIVAESRGLVRAGLAGLLAGWPHGPVQQAGTLDDALALLDPGTTPVLLLGLDLLGACGPAGLHAVRRQAPHARIIALAARESRDGILACLAAGAHGYVAETADFAELAHAIATVRGGGVHVPAGLAGPLPRRLGSPLARGLGGPLPRELGGPLAASEASGPAGAAPALTNRQQDVLRLLAEGRSTKDIARSLDLAVSTIKVHLAALYRTVGARNRVEALCRAGILPPLAHAL